MNILLYDVTQTRKGKLSSNDTKIKAITVENADVDILADHEQDNIAILTTTLCQLE